MGLPKFVVDLSEEERAHLRALLRSGTNSARRLTRARILLKADAELTDVEVAEAVGVGIATVHRIRQRCVEEGLRGRAERTPAQGRNTQVHREAARACHRPRVQYAARGPRALDAPAVGRSRGRVRSGRALLARYHPAHAKRNAVKPWQTRRWCIPTVGAAFVARMEDLLDLYAEPYDPARPVGLASMSSRSNSWPSSARRCRRRLDAPSRTTTSTPGPAWRISSCSATTAQAHVGRALRDVPSGRGPAPRAHARVPLHADARKLAQHRGDRAERVEPRLSRAAHPDARGLRHRSRRLSDAPQRRRAACRVALHLRQGPTQIAPPLFMKSLVTAY
jgi:hypothetical protein